MISNSYIAHTNLNEIHPPILHHNIKSILLNNGFQLSENTKSIYPLLYASLKNAIVNRQLSKNTKLPPTRVLGIDLGISRSTVLKAYELLVLENYIYSKQGSGYYISDVKQKKNAFKPTHHYKKGDYPKISKRGKSFLKQYQNKNENNKGVAFRPGLPPLDIFPVNLWKKLSNHYWKNVTPSQLSYADTGGIDSLKEHITNYLIFYRNINCHPDQVIITTGSLHSLSLIGDALIDKNDTIIIENPTYPLAYNLFKSLKANIVPTKLDNEGISLEGLQDLKPKLLYVTPSNQYPSGIKMSLERRIALTAFASKNKAIIIEDDYDHIFSNWQHPVSAIASMDKENRTIYLGTFNKLLHPSLRVGYMIVPDFLIDTIRALHEKSSRFVSIPTQAILSAFIEKDFLNKHIRNVIEVSMERKFQFSDRFETLFDEAIKLNQDNTGLHIIGKTTKEIDDNALSTFLLKNNIIAHPFSNYFIGKNKHNGLVMGYSSVNNKIIRNTLEKFKETFDSYVSVSKS